ncbi:MAG: transposase, partial [Acidimicrobiaceae bacterium]|nr:transposase [Acidimicrobiaceae bacterium]
MFDVMAAWLAKLCSKSAVTEVMRVAWRTVGVIAERVVADAQQLKDPLAGLTRIG